jgi:hypothetical protein
MAVRDNGLPTLGVQQNVIGVPASPAKLVALALEAQLTTTVVGPAYDTTLLMGEGANAVDRRDVRAGEEELLLRVFEPAADCPLNIGRIVSRQWWKFEGSLIPGELKSAQLAAAKTVFSKLMSGPCVHARRFADVSYS